MDKYFFQEGKTPAHLAIFLQVNGERFYVVIEAQIAECHQQIVSIHRFSIFCDTALDGLTADEGDELGDTLLYALSGILGYFAILRYGHLHYFDNIANGQKAVLLTQHDAVSIVSV